MRNVNDSNTNNPNINNPNATHTHGTNPDGTNTHGNNTHATNQPHAPNTRVAEYVKFVNDHAIPVNAKYCEVDGKPCIEYTNAQSVKQAFADSHQELADKTKWEERLKAIKAQLKIVE